MPRKPKVTPTYMTGKKPLSIGLHDVVRALKVIEEHGELDAFLKAAKRKKIKLLAAPETVNFVKDFVVAKNMHEHAVGKHIVNPKGSGGGSPNYECDFGDH